jgi:hypothetical protein
VSDPRLDLVQGVHPEHPKFESVLLPDGRYFELTCWHGSGFAPVRRVPVENVVCDGFVRCVALRIQLSLRVWFFVDAASGHPTPECRRQLAKVEEHWRKLLE